MCNETVAMYLNFSVTTVNVAVLYLKETIGEAEPEPETVNKECDTLTKYYTKLTCTLTDIDSLLGFFVEGKVIGFQEERAILNHNKTSSEKVKELISHIEGPLQSGNTKGFYELLDIMKSKGVQSTKDLADDMEKNLRN